MAALVRTSLVISLALFLLATASDAGLLLHHTQQVESDAGYTQCLACHDGVLAPNASPCLATVCFFRGPHPVARSYPPPDKSGEFSSREEAEGAGIRFLAGQIDCISCHNLYNTERYHLRLGAADSRLCFACHRK